MPRWRAPCRENESSRTPRSRSKPSADPRRITSRCWIAMKTGKTLPTHAGSKHFQLLGSPFKKLSRVIRDDEFLHERTDVLPRRPRRSGTIHFDMGRGEHRSENHALRIGRESIIQNHFTRHEWRTISELGSERPQTAAAANQEVRQALVGAEYSVRYEKKRCVPGERAFHARYRRHERIIGKLSDFISLRGACSGDDRLRSSGDGDAAYV